jgi:hypothetical protein
MITAKPPLRNSRKTERGASKFLTRLAVRAAPFALPTSHPVPLALEAVNVRKFFYSHAALLPGEKLENEKIRRMETCHRNMNQVLIALRDVSANQNAKLFYGDTQLLGRLGFGVLRLRLLGWERACVHGF